MNKIKTIISLLNTEQIRKFSLFIEKRYQIQSRKDLQLLHLIHKHPNWSKDKYSVKLYDIRSNKAKHAFSQLHGKLRMQLEHFLLMHESQKDNKYQAWSLLSTARFLLKKDKKDLALSYLYKAEKNAKKNKNYQILNTIYEMILENQSVFSHKIEQVVNLKNKNLAHLIRQTNIISANAQVNYQVKLAYLNNIKINVLDKLVEIYKTYGIDIFSEENKLLNLQAIRHAGLVIFDSNRYEETIIYLDKQIQIVENKFDVLSDDILIYKIHYLHLISLSYFKLKNYKNCEDRLNVVSDLLKINSSLSSKMNIIQFNTLRADLYFILGDIDKSIYILLEGLKVKKSHRDECLMNINLVGQYFANNKLKEAALILDKLKFKEYSFLNYFGELMVFKKYIEEIIIAFDQNERFDYINHLIVALKRKFRKYIANSDNHRDYLFIRLLDQLNKNRELISDKSFKIKVAQFINMQDIDPLGHEVISYDAWLKSKIENRDYYEVYLEMTG